MDKIKTFPNFLFTLFLCVICITSCTHLEKAKEKTLEFASCEDVDVIYTTRKGRREVTKKAVLKKCNSTESFDRGKNLAIVERWKEALVEFKADVQENPDDAYAHFNLGVAYEANGKFRMALAEYDKAFDIKPTEGYFQQAWKRAEKSKNELR